MIGTPDFLLDRPPFLDPRESEPIICAMASTDTWAPTDPLGEALHLLRMNGAYYCRSELSAPWGLMLPPMRDHLWFHVVTAGTALLQTGEAAPVAIRPGELALVPHGEGHSLQSAPGASLVGILDLPLEAVSDRYEILRHGGGGAPTTMVCGAVRFDHPAARHLVTILPQTIHVQATSFPQRDWMHSTLMFMANEAKELRPGGEEVITRLGDIVVIQAIRSWIETDPTARNGWLGAFQDPQIGRALYLIHREPTRRWTVAALATELAISRSAFAARFTKLVGEPVMQYLTRWRMYLALDTLQREQTTAAELATRFGYHSEAAFARAFKRVIGVPPGSVRHGQTDRDIDGPATD
jgi:AraC-like DNA-binding protein